MEENKTKYRVVEHQYLDEQCKHGKSYYTVQYLHNSLIRRLFRLSPVWKTFEHIEYDDISRSLEPIKFDSFSDTQTFIRRIIKGMKPQSWNETYYNYED